MKRPGTASPTGRRGWTPGLTISRRSDRWMAMPTTIRIEHPFPMEVARHAQDIWRTFARRALPAEEAFSLAKHVDLTPQDIQ